MNALRHEWKDANIRITSHGALWICRQACGKRRIKSQNVFISRLVL